MRIDDDRRSGRVVGGDHLRSLANSNRVSSSSYNRKANLRSRFTAAQAQAQQQVHSGLTTKPVPADDLILRAGGAHFPDQKVLTDCSLFGAV